MLTKRGAEVLVNVERLMDDAERNLAKNAPVGQKQRGASLGDKNPLMSELEGAATVHGVGN
jgi:hypothetical protein